MKKLLTIATVILAVMMISVTAFSDGRLMGDVDASGDVTAADARSTLRVAAKLDTFSDEQLVIADMDKNGDITAADARLVLRVSAKLDAARELEEKTTGIDVNEPSEASTVLIPEETTTAIPEDVSVLVPEDPSEEATDDELPSDTLTEPIQALYDGKFMIACEESDEYANYKTVIAVADDVGYYEWACEWLYDGGYSETYGSGYIIDGDETVYEFSTPEMIAGILPEDEIEMYYTGTVIHSLKNIAANHTEYNLSTETYGGVQYDVYTFNDPYNIIKIFISDGEIERFIQYDAVDYYAWENLIVTEFKTDFDISEINTDRFTVYPYDEYCAILYGDDYDDDYYYLDDEYWASVVDWDSIDGTLIENDEDLPEEYFLVASDKFYIDSFCRTIASEDDMFAEGDYMYYETMMYYNDDVIKICDMYGISMVYTMEKNLLGQEEVACYLVYEDGGVYTQLNQIITAMFATDYEELTQYDMDELKLIEDKEHTVTVKEAELDGENYKLISCAYTDGSYVSNFCFRDGELISIDEYDQDGNYQGTMIVYDFATEFDDSVTSLDSYEEVSAFDFTAMLFEF